MQLKRGKWTFYVKKKQNWRKFVAQMKCRYPKNFSSLMEITDVGTYNIIRSGAMSSPFI